MKALFKTIEESQSQYVQELTELCRFKSISPVPGYEKEIRACAEAFAALMRSAGMESTVFETAGNPIVFGQTPVQPGCRTVLIYGHYDVQPEGDLSKWDSDPYAPEIRNGRLYARGVGDNKGQIYAHIKGYEAYCKRFGQPKVNLKFMIEGEEESGSGSLTTFAEEHRELLKADFTIWSDGNYHNSGRPTVILGLKGMCYCHVRAHGPCRDIHSQYAAVTESPVFKLVRLLDSMKDGDGRVLIPHFYDEAMQPGEKELAAIRQIPGGIEAFAADWGLPDLGRIRDPLTFYTKYMYEPTLNIGCIRAGYPEGGKNIVPESAEAWLDMRLVPPQKVEVMAQRFKDFVADSGIDGIEVDCRGKDPAYSSIDMPELALLQQVIRDVWQQEPVIYPGHGGSGPFHVFNLILNAPCLMVPFADAMQNDHGPNESLPVRNLILGIQTSAALLDALGR